MIQSTITRSNSCPAGLNSIPVGRGMPPVDKIKEEVQKPMLYGKSVAVVQNTVASVRLCHSIRREFSPDEFPAVRECIKDFILEKSPLRETEQPAIEQGLVWGCPVEVDSDHTSQFITRLAHVKILDRDPELKIIKAGQEMNGSAAFIYQDLLQNHSATPALHKSSNTR